MQAGTRKLVESFLNGCANEAGKLLQAISQEGIGNSYDETLGMKLRAIMEIQKREKIDYELRRGLKTNYVLGKFEADSITPNGKSATVIKLWSGCENYPETKEEIDG